MRELLLEYITKEVIPARGLSLLGESSGGVISARGRGFIRGLSPLGGSSGAPRTRHRGESRDRAVGPRRAGETGSGVHVAQRRGVGTHRALGRLWHPCKTRVQGTRGKQGGNLIELADVYGGT